MSRYGNEVEDLEMTGHGEQMQVGTYIEKMFHFELSRNVIGISAHAYYSGTSDNGYSEEWTTSLQGSTHI